MAIQEAAVTDPSLCECLDVGERTRDLCHQILSTIENNGAAELSEEGRINRSRTHKLLNALMTQLKGLHRAAIISAREAKETTSEARREVDRLHLQLQNLYYEQRHLRGEINACREFPHKYTSLPLISQEEFLTLHPQHQQDDPHNLMIARLNNEKAVREDLEKQRKELLAKKQSLIAENKKRKEDLASLDEQLKKFIEVFVKTYPDNFPQRLLGANFRRAICLVQLLLCIIFVCMIIYSVWQWVAGSDLKG